MQPEQVIPLRSFYNDTPISCELPLGIVQYEEIRTLIGHGRTEAIKSYAATLLWQHDLTRIADPACSNGHDLNNFYAMYRWLTGGWMSQFEEIKTETVVADELTISRSRMVTLLKNAFAAENLNAATIYDDFRAAWSDWRGEEYHTLCQKLRGAYITMRRYGFTDTALIR